LAVGGEVGLANGAVIGAARFFPAVASAVAGREAGEVLRLQTIPPNGVERIASARNFIVVQRDCLAGLIDDPRRPVRGVHFQRQDLHVGRKRRIVKRDVGSAIEADANRLAKFRTV
jgi:hypothetical protein